MTHTLKRTFAMLLLAVFGSAILYNCEPDPDSLGQQLFDKDAAIGAEDIYNVIGYNINNKDSIQSDGSKLLSVGGSGTAVLGAFTDSQFGTQKASYFTQLRMPSDNYDFGDKPVIDSVVLVIRTPANTADDTYYLADQVKAPGAYDKNDFLVDTEKVAVSIEKKTYPVRTFGKTDGTMKINVHRVEEFLDQTASNAKVKADAFLGSGIFDGNVSTVTVTKKSDGTKLVDTKLGFRINLDKNEFQRLILDKKGDQAFNNAANFTRYFNGIKLSVEEDNGYLFQFAANDMELHLFYKSDRTVDGTIKRTPSIIDFDLGSKNNHLGKYEYKRGGFPVAAALDKPNKDNGDESLFVQGMGGPSVGLKIEKSTIKNLKDRYNTNKAAIVGAKLRVYVDKNKTESNTQFSSADRKFILLAGAPGSGILTDDFKKGFPMYYYGKATVEGTEYEYYDFVVTQALKNIVETNTIAAADQLLYLNLGAFVKSQDNSGAIRGIDYTTTPIDMNRVALFGIKKTPIDPKKPDQRVQLRVTYSTAK